MKRACFVMGLFLMFFLGLAGCPGPESPTGPAGPSVPAGLISIGSLGHIMLNWNGSTGANLTGYNIYRSEDGVHFSKTPDSPIAAPTVSYDDTDVQDGILYSYKVTAVGDAESDFSNTVREIHGTRLDYSYNVIYTTSYPQSAPT
jgi:fibronectin type 3 domain-containing protein